MKTHCVIIFQVWLGHQKRWSWRMGAEPLGREGAPVWTDNMVGLYMCEAASRQEAIGIVGTWLAKGKPSSMTVQELKR